MSWESISTDPVVGNEQPDKAYWKRIAEHYHENHTFHSDRSVNSPEKRWVTIKKECNKFQAICEQVERRHPCGVPYKEHLLEAQTMFARKNSDKAFQFLHCWLKVRNCPKFQSVDRSHRRPRPSKSSTPSEEAKGDETGKNQTTDSSQVGQKKRPIGRKEAKQRLKNGGEAGPYKEAIDELILEKKDEKKLRAERWQETKLMHQQKLTLKKDKLMWEQEQKIMFCDVSTLDKDQKTYVLAMRAQIAAQKMAALSGGFDGGFGASSGGDVDGAAQ